MEPKRLQRQQQQHLRGNGREWRDCARAQCFCGQVQRFNNDYRRQLSCSKLVRRVDERFVHRRVLLEPERCCLQQQQHVWNDVCERCFSACQRLGMLKLQCFEHQQNLFSRSELVRRVDERVVRRRVRLEFEPSCFQQQPQCVRSNDCERCVRACQRLRMLKLQCFEHQWT